MTSNHCNVHIVYIFLGICLIRSHAVLILYLESRAFTADTAALNGSPGASPERPHGHSAGLRMSKLTFVDMAGADRLEISGAVGDTLVESQNINLSLNAFGMLIRPLLYFLLSFF